MIDDINTDADHRMKMSVEAVRQELKHIRTGRANVELLDHVKVDYYGTLTPLSQAATVGVMDPRTLSVQPWDKTMVEAVEKAIRDSDLGLNPATAGDVIRVPLPALTEERRKEMQKVARTDGENGRIAIRNIRRDALHHLKELLKEKEINEDDERRAEDAIQKLTDKYVAEIDALVSEKEKDIMEI
ncbi:MAG: ribosome recycling factor [Gammaproteobacteria bacterium]|jgi:ribosome recycling factor|nr:ribosome recycling factor [Gammaproteobacteria bacterium]